MSTTIDQKVVEMRFDNGEFERGVQRSVDSINELKKSLDFTGVEKNTASIGDALKNLPLNDISRAVQNLEDRFSTFGIAGMVVIERLTNACIDFVTHGLGKIFSLISSKGIARAFNIENAHFLLQGLLDDETQVKAVMKVANDSVTDTAYGYDEAAKAAANFVASGMTADQLVRPMQAIAGVAATVNADYGRIADLFTTVAGQGRVMTRNLYSFSALGLNVPATMAKYLQGLYENGKLAEMYPNLIPQMNANKKVLEAFAETGTITERVVREMVTAGIVDFGLFSNALDDAFGKHAKKANETFNGAMSNVRAALGRVGAKFVSPLIAQNSAVVKLINAVRVKINEINAATNSLAKNVTSFILAASMGIGDWLNSFTITGDWFSNIQKSVPIVKERVRALFEIISALGSVFKNLLLPAVHGFQATLTPLGKKMDQVAKSMDIRKWGEMFSGLIRTALSLDEAIGKRLTETFKNFFELFSGPKTKDMKRMFNTGVVSDILSYVHDIVNGFASAIDIFTRLLTGSLKVLKNFVPIVAGAFKVLLSIFAWIGRLITRVDELLSQSKLIENVVSFLSRLVSNFGDVLGLVVNLLGSFYNAVANRFTDLTKKLAPFKNFMDGLGRVFVEVFGIISDTVASVFKSISDAFHSNGGYNSILDFLNSFLVVGLGFKYLKKEDNNFFKDMVKDIFDGFKSLVNLDFTPLTKSLTELVDTFRDSKTYSAFKDMAIAVAILAVSLLILASIEPAKLAQSLGALSAMFLELGAMLKFMSKTSLNAKGKISAIAALIEFSMAVLVLSIALKKIADIEPEKLVASVVAISVLIGELMLVIAVTSKYKPNKLKKATSSLGNLLAFSAAVYILALSVKKISDLEPKSLIIGISGVSAMIIALSIAAKVANNSGKKNTSLAGFISFSISVYILCQALKAISDMSPESLIGSVLAITGIIGAMAVAIKYGGLNSFGAKNGLAIVEMALALLLVSKIVKTIGEMGIEQATKGVIALAACVGVLIIAAKSMDGIKMTGAVALLLVSAALASLVPTIKILGSMSVTQIAKALIVFAGSLTILGIAASLLAPLTTTLLALTGVLVLFGAAVLAVGVGVAALGVGLTSIAVSGAAAAGSLVLIIEGLVLGLIDVVERSLVNILDAVKNILLGLVDVFVECAPAIINGVLIILDDILKGIVDYLPSILDSLIEIVLLLLDGLAKAIPDILVKIFEVLDAIIIGVSKRLKEIGTTSFKDLLKALLEMAALMIGLSALSHLAIPALKGVAVFGLVLGALIGVMALIGGINEMIPGLQTFVESGGDLLLAVGTAIGKFFGGIIGGIAEGVTHSLPAMAEDFSAFMENLKPFIEGSKNITPEAMAGVADLAKAILALTAANVIDQIAKFLGAETSLVSFGEELAEFGPYLATFANSVSDIDGDKVSASANAAKILAEMAKSLPNTGGVISWFTGDNPIEEFGSKLVSFGEDFKAYSDSISGIDSDAISNSAVMAKSLSELASNLPNNGGVVSWFTGDNGIDDFGEALISFGGCLVNYSEKVSETDSEAVARSIDDFRALLSLVEDVEGANGSALTTFSYGITNLGHTAVNDFIGCFTGAYTDVDEAVGGMIDTAANAIEVRIPIIVQSMYGITEVMVQALNDGKNWITVGGEIVADLVRGMKSKSKDAKDAVASFVLGMITEIRSRYLEFVQAGQYLVDGFVSGVGLKSTAVKLAARKVGNDALNTLNNTLQVHSPSRITEKTGKFFVLGFVNGMLENVGKAFTSAEEVGSSARDGLTKICSQIEDMVSNSIDANPTIRPVLDLTDVQAKSKQLSHLVGTDQALAVGSGTKGTAAMLLNASRKTDPIQNGPIITIQNMNVDGAENPEEWAHQFVSSLYRQVRMGVV